MSWTLQRPKPGETEEDVLALQNEFLKSGSQPSATLVKQTGDRKLQDSRTNAKVGFKGIIILEIRM